MIRIKITDFKFITDTNAAFPIAEVKFTVYLPWIIPVAKATVTGWLGNWTFGDGCTIHPTREGFLYRPLKERYEQERKKL